MKKAAIEQSRFQQKFAKDALRGRHFFSLSEELNKELLRECHSKRRDPADLIRIILEDRYLAVKTSDSVEVERHGQRKSSASEAA
jgi:hypothetical protein